MLGMLSVAFGFALASTALSGATDPMQTVRQYIAAFNKGDAKAMTANCASPTSILDGMASLCPSRGTSRQVDVTGDSAYVVVPATMTFKVKGQEVRQSDATFTVALRKLEQGWRITTWAWAKGSRG